MITVLHALRDLLSRPLRERRESAERREQSLRLELAERELAEEKRDGALAESLHDAATAELTSIVILSQTAANGLTDRDPGRVDRQTLLLINEQARKALDNLHESIRLLLSRDAEPRRSTDPAPVRLRDVLADGDVYLHRLGFSGSSMIVSGPSTDGLLVNSFVAGLLKELYANVARHATPHSDEYGLLVDVRDGDLVIRQINTVNATPERELHSGYGLSFFRSAVSAMGGTFDAGKHDDGWFLNVTIPLRALKRDSVPV
ncbi:histidine kinase [Bifidobacterium amazonense]|uniref:Histidine kinase n=1 Tax=Bifidobacterium amazonense TaxID=2809027 RepID=A0ABS9VTL8_9BIFI|nr:histidine kinase [Bifidobacterium amazonense]MCH9275428.1 histidine kinase [Bifidobacterium amazonense]